jgi:K+-sensing histidine kinase KdpD
LKEEALRMSVKVNKLLDMARLQAGKVQLNRQWQPLGGSRRKRANGYMRHPSRHIL